MPLKLSILICHFAYGGNGGIQSEHPDIREWEVEAVLKMKADPRIGEIYLKTISDTPITMTRNRAVRYARELKADLVLFIDSDQSPNKHKGEPWHREFFGAAFDKIYDHYPKGPLCIGAPYCGPPNGTENVYVFQWGNYGVRGDETKFSLDQYTRAEAAKMSGIQECAALPTGMILIDMRCFDLIEPSTDSKRATLEKLQSGQITLDDAEWALRDGYFYYEYPNQLADEKCSTEDVTCTRDISLAGMAKLGYNPVMCAWDSWVGHHKPWNVGKPGIYGVDQISANFKRAVLADQNTRDKIIDAGQFTKKIPPSKKPVVFIEPTWKDAHTTPEEDIAALQQLVREIITRKGSCRVLEVGSWLGGTAIAMADAGAEVNCVDTWEGTPGDRTGELAEIASSEEPGCEISPVMAEFLNRIDHRRNVSIFPWKRTSLESAAMHWDPFDLIFIDAEHTEKAAGEDSDAWEKHLAEDGYMCFHDYDAIGFPGVKKAVDKRFHGRSRQLLGRTLMVISPALEPVA